MLHESSFYLGSLLHEKIFSSE